MVVVGVLGFWSHCAWSTDDADHEGSQPSRSVSHEDNKKASAQPEHELSDARASDDQGRGFPHGGQFSLRFGLVGAERIMSRYDSSPTCGLDDEGKPKKFCGFGAPLALDLSIGFAPFSSLEPFAWARFGLASETTTHTQPLVALGVGARIYTASDSAFKFFIQPAVGWELEGGTDNHPPDPNIEYKKDFLIQLLAGPQYDFAKNVGAYLGFGVTAGMLRAIQSWLEVDFGVQARF